jgi:hypothetical protein
VNNPPVFTPIPNQAILELSPLTLAAQAVDPDSPPARLIYSLDEPPPGATIDAQTGLVAWTPSESQGPSSYLIRVRATENDAAGLSSVFTFAIAVDEVNSPPRLSSLPNIEIVEGQTIAFTCAATDDDLPPQKLVYRIDAGAPSGAELDPNTGGFTWATRDDQGASTNSITIRVTDGGAPELGDSSTFSIIVRAQPKVVINEIMFHPAVAKAEFIELHNFSAVTAQDLSGWQLVGTGFTFPPGTVLEPGAFLAVARDRSVFQATYGPNLPVIGNYPEAIPPESATLSLRRPIATNAVDHTVVYQVIDEVTFDNRLPWPKAADGLGPSLQLVDPRQDNDRVGNWLAVQGLITNQPQTAIRMTNIWKYNQSGENLRTAWKETDYPDASWPAGAALLYVESAAMPAPKNTPLTLGPTTFYFRTRFQFNGNPDGASVRISTVLDDGAIFYLNGHDFFRLGMPTGTVASTTFANRTVSDAALEGPFTITVDSLRQGENVLAVEVHQINATSSDIVFGMSLDIIEVQRASYTPGMPNSVRAQLAPFPLLWINEVLPNNTQSIADLAGEREPWIELYHSGTNTLELTDFFLTDSYANLTRWPLPAKTSLGAGQFVLIWADGEDAEHSPTQWHANFRLNPAQGSVVLAQIRSGKPVVVDYLDYQAPQADQSIGSLPDGAPKWRTILGAPTPGAQNKPSSTNSPPVLDAIPDFMIRPGQTLAFKAAANDPDTEQVLTFSLAPGSPSGAQIDAQSGAFNWTPLNHQAPSTNALIIRVTDNGQPPLSDESAFAVIVQPALALIWVTRVTVINHSEFMLAWTAEPGQIYQVQAKDDLNQATWQNLGQPVLASSTEATFNDSIEPGQQRFYRVILVTTPNAP